MSEVWLVSSDEERWTLGEEFASQAEAVAGAAEELELGPGDRFWAGRKAEVEVRELVRGLGDDALQCLSEQSYEAAGEASEDWPSPSKEEEADLQAVLAEAVASWVSRHCLTPSFFRLVDVDEHRVPEPDDTPEAGPFPLVDVARCAASERGSSVPVVCTLDAGHSGLHVWARKEGA